MQLGASYNEASDGRTLKAMSEENQENLSVKVAELEVRLNASLNVIGKLVKALDYMRSGDARFIFEIDLVKHSLCEAGYAESTTSDAQEGPPEYLSPLL